MFMKHPTKVKRPYVRPTSVPVRLDGRTALLQASRQNYTPTDDNPFA